MDQEHCLESNHDDNDGDDDDELFLQNSWLTKGFKPNFQPGPLPEIQITVNLRHAASWIWTCPEPEFRLCRMKLCSGDNHYTTMPQNWFFRNLGYVVSIFTHFVLEIIRQYLTEVMFCRVIETWFMPITFFIYILVCLNIGNTYCKLSNKYLYIHRCLYWNIHVHTHMEIS